MKLWMALMIGVLIYSNLTLAIPTVSFFEEFPNETTLDKVVQIDFDTKIYVAARNLSEFYGLEEDFKLNNEKVRVVVYWPVLEREEGYWISPWSDSNALERIFEEIKERKDKRDLEILLDLEPPLKRLRLFSFGNFKQNKKYIAEFIMNAESNNLSITTVEKSYVPEWILKMFGLSFGPEEYGNRKIKMYYSSYRRIFLPNFVVDKLFERKARIYGKNEVSLGVGLIAPGIHDEKHSLSPETLRREIEIASEYDIEEIIIFQLSGFNDNYRKAVEIALKGSC